MNQELDFDSWLQFASLILNRSIQHITAVDNRIYYILASDTALLILLGGGIIVFLDKLSIYFSIVLMLPIVLGGASLWIGIRVFRPKIGSKLLADKKRPTKLHMFSTDIEYRTREEYVKDLRELGLENIKNEIAHYIYDLGILLRTKSKLFDKAVILFKWTLITSIFCVISFMLFRIYCEF
jgi:hypothetical protein